MLDRNRTGTGSPRRFAVLHTPLYAARIIMRRITGLPNGQRDGDVPSATRLTVPAGPGTARSTKL
jgi:hypothetical protein